MLSFLVMGSMVLEILCDVISVFWAGVYQHLDPFFRFAEDNLGLFQAKFETSGEKPETMSHRDAAMFPLISSCALFGLYLIFKVSIIEILIGRIGVLMIYCCRYSRRITSIYC